MTTNPPPRTTRGRLKWVFAAAAAALLIAVAVLTIWLTQALRPTQEAPMPNSKPPAAEVDDLRPKGSAEDALARYETRLAQTADEITTLVPGLSWRWYYEDTTVSCTGALADTDAVQVLTRHVVFDGPIPDAQWTRAVDVVVKRAAELGADNIYTYIDKPGDHDIAITGGGGVEVRFGTKAATNLSARSDCYLKQADIPAHGD
jgi:hypothetical protein